MCDKQDPNPTACGQSIIITGIHHDSLRDEIYMQIIKQLTENSNSNSVTRGWMLMGYCLICFSPNLIQNYLEYFLWKNCKYPQQMLNLLYTKLEVNLEQKMELIDVRHLLE